MPSLVNLSPLILSASLIACSEPPSPAGTLLTAKSRVSGAVVKIILDGDRIVCIHGLAQFPETGKISLHPTNSGGYEITPGARNGEGVEASLSNHKDYLIIRDAKGKEIAKWSAQGNILTQTPLTVLGVPGKTLTCEIIKKDKR